MRQAKFIAGHFNRGRCYPLTTGNDSLPDVYYGLRRTSSFRSVRESTGIEQTAAARVSRIASQTFHV